MRLPTTPCWRRRRRPAAFSPASHGLGAGTSRSTRRFLIASKGGGGWLRDRVRGVAPAPAACLSWCSRQSASGFRPASNTRYQEGEWENGV
eukprot:453572-Alexandrium_andersonii.AAC.1